MRAFVLHGHGGFDQLRLHHDWPTPSPKPGEVLIRVQACGLNNTDINTRTGWYSKTVTDGTTGGAFEGDQDADGGWDGGIEFPRIQGGDPVGIVVAAGEGADSSLIGRRVLVDTVLRDWDNPQDYASTTYLGSGCDGGFADYMTIDMRNVHPIDTEHSSAELATFAISYSTAENMLNRASVGPDDVVLIPGASGGVGSALVQLAKRRGAKTVAMASPDKHSEVARLGPTALLPREVDDLAAALSTSIGCDTVTVAADIVGGDQFPALIDVLERGGRYTCSGAIAGPIVELDLRTMYLRDLTFHGCTIFEPKVFPDLVRYVEAGEIVPMLAATYPLEDLHDAQSAFVEKRHTGNIVVTME
ncbi:MAG: alcohol dehydrogenase family protein [Ahrensia sp.]|nr:alcohol dehydrogenase family protein [Ahrensia sp.]